MTTLRNLFIKSLVGIILWGMSSSAIAQDMNEGFRYLEKGHFKKAKIFFEEVLKSYPTNKTALLCYGRAVGLSGDANQALTIFNDLEGSYPGDMEIMLNKAEAFLWNKDSHSAIVAYQQILQADSTSFAGWLGSANSHSMSKNYVLAYQFINKALEIDPNNEQAKISRKYIILGYANMLASEKSNINGALRLIQQNLSANDSDQETIALKANIEIVGGLYQEAYDSYEKLKDPVARLIGQSTAKHLLKENKEALEIVQTGLEALETKIDSTQLMKLNLQVLNAMLWNGSLKEASIFLDSMKVRFSEDPEILIAEARLALYYADFIKGSSKYEEYLQYDSTSFEGNLGSADSNHALNMDRNSYNHAFNTLNLYPGQKDALNFVSKLNKIHSPTYTFGFKYNKSSDGSVNRQYTHKGEMSFSPVLHASIQHEKRIFASPFIEQSSSRETLTFQVNRAFGKRYKLNVSYGLQKVNTSEESNDFNRSDVDVLLDILVNRTQKTTVGFLTEVQDFNQALIEQNLKSSSIVVKNAVFWKVPSLGWYTEAYRSFYSDGNKRSLVFTSFYKTLTKSKFLKIGVNYLYLAFAENKPFNYYSPTWYHQVEYFGGVTYTSKSYWPSVMLDGAIGYQWAQGANQQTWRAKLSLKKEIKMVALQAFAEHSSIAATSAQGFSNTILGIEAQIVLTTKPLFYKKIKADHARAMK